MSLTFGSLMSLYISRCTIERRMERVKGGKETKHKVIKRRNRV